MAPRGLVVAAGSAAVLLGAPAFITVNAPGEGYVPAHAQGLAAPQLSSKATFGKSAAAALSMTAAGALAAGVMLGRSRKVARAGVLTKDDDGRFRFDVPMPEIVPSQQPGVSAPLGFFDPLGFTKNPLMVFPKDPNGFKHLREAEIKNGRVAMMASIGNVAAHYWKFPGCEDVPTGIAALNNDKGALGFAVLVTFVGLLEGSEWKARSSGEPGSFGDPFGFKQYTPEMRTKELNNCRLAMFATMGQLVAELQTGLDPVQQLGI